MLETDADNPAVTFNWTDAFTYSAKVATNKNYAVQIDKAGNNFKNPAELSSGITFTKIVSVSELNAAVVQTLKVLPGNVANFEVRVACTLNGFAPIYSNVIPVTVNPYYLTASYSSIYVPGSYQGWSPDKAPALASINDDGKYEGYINFPDPTTSFKFTQAQNWNSDFGDEAATGDSGKLKLKGTDMKAKAPGYYFITADTIELKWKAVATTWAVVGDAPSDWNTDKDLKYDAATNAWLATLPLKKGEMKFRANKTNDISYGDRDADGSLESDGDNIKIDADGTYTIKLLLGKPGNYVYSLKKN